MDTKIKYENRKRDMLQKRKARQKTTEFKVGQKALNHELRNKGVDGFMAAQDAKQKKQEAQERASSESEVMSSMLSGLDMPPFISHTCGRTTKTIYGNGEKTELHFLDGELVFEETTKL